MSRASWGKVRKLPSGNFQASYIAEGGRRVNAPATFTTKRAARAWLATQQARISAEENGMAPKQAEKPPLPDKTLQQAYNLYFDACERRGLSPGTLRSYRSHWNAHIAPALGKMQLQAITEGVIKDWLQSKKSTSEKKKAESLSTLQRILQTAVEQKWLYENPAKDVHPTAGARKKAARRSYPILTHAQLEAIRAAMPPACAIAVDLGAWCALRSGEVCALRRKDIDLVEGVIKVRRAVKQGVRGEWFEGSPKSAAGVRDVALPPSILARLKDHMSKYVQSSREALLIHYPGKPDEFLRGKHLKNRFDKAVKAAGLPRMRFHDLRHTGLTAFARAGATAAELMHRAGHSDIQTAMIYQHAELARDRQLAAAMDTVI